MVAPGVGSRARRSGVGDEAETSLGREQGCGYIGPTRRGPPEEGTTRKGRKGRGPLAAGQTGSGAPWPLRNTPGGTFQAQPLMHIKIPWELFKDT